MANTIKLKRGTSTPSTSDIASGEVAVDSSAKKLYINDSGTVKEIGGGGGETDYGPYEYSFLTESDGIRVGYYYQDGILFYPTESEYISGSVILTPGFGGGSSTMSPWAEFYASHGFIAMRIVPNAVINDFHNQRCLGLIDAIESIRQENSRVGSPLYGLIDMDSFSVSGYSMGGGASHDAATVSYTHLRAHETLRYRR